MVNYIGVLEYDKYNEFVLKENENGYYDINSELDEFIGKKVKITIEEAIELLKKYDKNKRIVFACESTCVNIDYIEENEKELEIGFEF